jgi:hypothetical protein
MTVVAYAFTISWQIKWRYNAKYHSMDHHHRDSTRVYIIYRSLEIINTSLFMLYFLLYYQYFRLSSLQYPRVFRRSLINVWA